MAMTIETLKVGQQFKSVSFINNKSNKKVDTNMKMDKMVESVLNILKVNPMTQLAELIVFYLQNGFDPEQMILDCDGVNIRKVMEWYQRRMVKVTKHKTKDDFVKDFNEDKSGALERFWAEPFNYGKTLLLKCDAEKVWEVHNSKPDMPYGRAVIYM